MTDTMFNSPNDYMNRFYGYRVIEDIHMVDLDKPQHTEQRRTWKERLFTLPWRPFKKTKTMTTYPPMKTFYLAGRTLICHPVMKRELMSVIQTEGNIS